MRGTAMAAVAASGLALTVATAEETPTRQYAPADSTFSIIAVEKDTGLLGLGVQSKALSIGNRVVTGKGGVAIVAHQSSSNPLYGKLVIDGIERGMTQQQALEFVPPEFLRHAERAACQEATRRRLVMFEQRCGLKEIVRIAIIERDGDGVLRRSRACQLPH